MGCRNIGGVHDREQGPIGCWVKGAKAQESGSWIIVEIQGGLIQGVAWKGSRIVSRRPRVSKGAEGWNGGGKDRCGKGALGILLLCLDPRWPPLSTVFLCLPPLALSPSSQLRFPLALPRVSLAPCLQRSLCCFVCCPLSLGHRASSRARTPECGGYTCACTHAHMCLHTQTHVSSLRTGSAGGGTGGIIGGFFCFPGQWLCLVGMASLIGDWKTPPPPHQ